MKRKIKVSDLIREVRASQKSVYGYIKDLLAARILSEETTEKPALRYLKPNVSSEEGKLCFALLESERAIEFFRKHRQLAGAFVQFKKEIENIADTALIFGSFARNAETSESDIDIAIIGSKINKKQIERTVEHCFVTLKNRASVRILNTADFINSLRKNDEFALQILNEHIVAVNSYGWVNILSKTGDLA
ncbi:MAG: nucleotidyltransferase domain-containing protein [Nanoarchaeota archaeon]|nr:nucleotidyltransferase domain-containing protein [Nanoarchaeota archaeon]